MTERLEYVRCLLCDGDDTTMWAAAQGTERRRVRCRRDGLVYLNPRPVATTVLSFHENEFIRNDNLELFGSFRRQTLHREANTIKAFRPRGGNLLDIGCATGVFLENFRETQWRLYGVDPSCLGAERARGFCRAEIFRGTLCEAHYPSSFFDVVTVLDALFYFPDPRADLREVQRILKPNGLLAVEIPGFNHTRLRYWGPVALTLDGRWRSLSLRSNHLYDFSGRTLGLLLNRAGFCVQQMFPQQVSLGRGRFVNALGALHFALTKRICHLSGGRFSIAGKELYLAARTSEQDSASVKAAGKQTLEAGRQ